MKTPDPAPASREDLIYGMRPVMEALESGRPLEKIFLRKDLPDDRTLDVRTWARKRNVTIQLVPEQKLHQLAKGGVHQGIVALAPMIAYRELETTLTELTQRKRPPLLLLLDGITDVRNFGAICRSAECMGVDAVIVPANGSASINADAMKTSAGALNYLPIIKADQLTRAVQLIQEAGLRVLAVTEKTDGLVYDQDLSSGLCLIVGSEERGIASSLIRRADALVKLPLFGRIASLNVSVAVGMALSEVARQRLVTSRQG
ncbi:MAG: 23S rRNA (guanosine(2251)-2'-O)-methyltransferase RlmB [Bacteroidia bacterium]|nr:23S rRNA (guanosine(2251)-2'-O)-methyltransferase RlmB [Bacteroidia bacterium]